MTVIYSRIVNFTRSPQRGMCSLDEDRITWRTSSKADISVEILKKNIKEISWVHNGKVFTLNVFHVTEEGNEFDRFDNFSILDKQKIFDFIKENFGIPVKENKMCYAGLNCGALDVVERRKSMKISYEGDTSIEIPMKSISQVATPGKNEIELHFHEDKWKDNADVMVEMKVYVPPDDEMNDRSHEVKDLLENYTVDDLDGSEALVTFPEEVGRFISPRGEYTLRMFEDYFYMAGSTYNHKVQYSSVIQMFLLPYRDNRSQALVISLNNPIQQGNQRFNHLVLIIEQIDIVPGEVDITVKVPEEDIAEKYGGKLDTNPKGRLGDATAKIFKIFSRAKVFVPGDSYKSYHDEKMINCVVKTSQGYLYPLQRSFMFIHKPCIYCRYEDIDYVEFLLLSPGAKQFELSVSCRAIGTESSKQHKFAQIDKNEYTSLLKFLSTKKIKIKNLEETRRVFEGVKETVPHEDMFEESSDDADFNSDDDASGSSSESDSDVSLVSETNLHGDEPEENPDDLKEKPKKEKIKKEKKEEGESKKSSKKRKAESAGDKEPKKAKKPNRDPNAPKTVTSAYQFFSKEKRAELLAADSNISPQELMKQVGQAWHSATEEQKKKFEELNAEDKTRYEDEMKSYTPAPGYSANGHLITEKAAKKEATSSTATKEKKVKDPNAPKRPQSAYIFFNKEVSVKIRQEHPEMKMGEVSKLVGEKWKEASAEEKAKYEKMNEEDKARYDREMKNYKPPAESKESSSTKVKTEKVRKDSESKSPVSKKSSDDSAKKQKVTKEPAEEGKDDGAKSDSSSSSSSSDSSSSGSSDDSDSSSSDSDDNEEKN